MKSAPEKFIPASRTAPPGGPTFHGGARLVATALAAILAATSPGCKSTESFSLTQRLWAAPDIQGHYRPAADPRLEVFLHASGREALARYHELREKDASVRSRGLLLRAGAEQRSAAVRPDFASTTPPRTAAQLPLLAARAARVAEPHARWSPVPNEFFVNVPGWDSSPRQLPEYEDHKNPAGKILLTPFAVVGDAVIYGVLIGSVVGLFVLARSNGSIEIK